MTCILHGKLPALWVTNRTRSPALKYTGSSRVGSNKDSGVLPMIFHPPGEGTGYDARLQTRNPHAPFGNMQYRFALSRCGDALVNDAHIGKAL